MIFNVDLVKHTTALVSLSGLKHCDVNKSGQKRICIIAVIPWLLIKITNEKQGLLLIDMLQYVLNWV